MPLPLEIIVAAFVGFTAAFVLSIPQAGPVSLTIVGHAVEGRGRRSLRVAAGAAVAEGIWVLAAGLGLAPLLAEEPAVEHVAAGLLGPLLIFVGWHTMRRRATRANAMAHARTGRRRAMDVGLGFTMVLLNPGLLALWTVVTTWLTTRGLTATALGAATFTLGALGGVFTWFATLVRLAHKVGKRWSLSRLRMVRRAVGALLIAAGVWGLGAFVVSAVA